MQEATIALFAAWQNFYVIIGSAAAALTGLMFVVVTLIAGTRAHRSSGESLAAFGTPTVVHFCAALLVAAILNAPWPAIWYAAILLGLCGLAGVIYLIIVLRRERHQTDYQPVLEDWLWHTVLPFASYAAVLVAGIILPADPVPALFIIGAAAVLLLFIGIHNSWDTVTYLAIRYSQPGDENQDEQN